jgi:hypothetical protein
MSDIPKCYTRQNSVGSIDTALYRVAPQRGRRAGEFSCHGFGDSFANPAVTIAGSLSDTFAGIAPAGVAAFIIAQMAGMLAAVILSRWLWRERKCT